MCTHYISFCQRWGSIRALSLTVYSMLCDGVLAFIKAYRLKGNNSTLKSKVAERFDASLVADAKKKKTGSPVMHFDTCWLVLSCAA